MHHTHISKQHRKLIEADLHIDAAGIEDEGSESTDSFEGHGQTLTVAELQAEEDRRAKERAAEHDRIATAKADAQRKRRGKAPRRRRTSTTSVAENAPKAGGAAKAELRAPTTRQRRRASTTSSVSAEEAAAERTKLRARLREQLVKSTRGNEMIWHRCITKALERTHHTLEHRGAHISEFQALFWEGLHDRRKACFDNEGHARRMVDKAKPGEGKDGGKSSSPARARVSSQVRRHHDARRTLTMQERLEAARLERTTRHSTTSGLAGKLLGKGDKKKREEMMLRWGPPEKWTAENVEAWLAGLRFRGGDDSDSSDSDSDSEDGGGGGPLLFGAEAERRKKGVLQSARARRKGKKRPTPKEVEIMDQVRRMDVGGDLSSPLHAHAHAHAQAEAAAAAATVAGTSRNGNRKSQAVGSPEAVRARRMITRHGSLTGLKKHSPEHGLLGNKESGSGGGGGGFRKRTRRRTLSNHRGGSDPNVHSPRHVHHMHTHTHGTRTSTSTAPHSAGVEPSKSSRARSDPSKGTHTGSSSSRSASARQAAMTIGHRFKRAGIDGKALFVDLYRANGCRFLPHFDMFEADARSRGDEPSGRTLGDRLTRDPIGLCRADRCRLAVEMLKLAGSGLEDFISWASGSAALLLWLDTIGMWRYHEHFRFAVARQLHGHNKRAAPLSQHLERPQVGGATKTSVPLAPANAEHFAALSRAALKDETCLCKVPDARTGYVALDWLASVTVMDLTPGLGRMRALGVARLADRQKIRVEAERVLNMCSFYLGGPITMVSQQKRLRMEVEHRRVLQADRAHGGQHHGVFSPRRWWRYACELALDARGFRLYTPGLFAAVRQGRLQSVERILNQMAERGLTLNLKAVEFTRTHLVELRDERELKSAAVLLRRVKIFRSLINTHTDVVSARSQSLLDVARSLTKVHFSKGQVIVKEGDVGDSFFVLQDGQVGIYKTRARAANPSSKDGADRVVAFIDQDSEEPFFGERSLITNNVRSGTVRAASATVTCYRLGRPEFNSLQGDLPRIPHCTLVQIAVRETRTAMLEFLLQIVHDEDVVSAMSLMAAQNMEQILPLQQQTLLINWYHPCTRTLASYDMPCTNLIDAVLTRNHPAVELLLGTPGFNLVAHSDVQNLCWQQAIVNNQTDTLQLLCQAHAQSASHLVWAQNNDQLDAIHLRKFRPSLLTVEVATNDGRQSHRSPVVAAAACGSAEENGAIMAILLDRYMIGIDNIQREATLFDPNIADDTGMTALMHACKLGHPKHLELLLRYSLHDHYTVHNYGPSTRPGIVDVNAQDDVGKTALMHAALNGHVAAVKMVLDPAMLTLSVRLQGGTDIVDVNRNVHMNMECNQGMTALHYASASDTELESIVKLLIKEKCLVNQKDSQQCTPLHYACHKGHVKVVQALLHYNANVSSCNVWGQTPLHLAAKKGYVSIVTTLLRKGAKADAEDWEKRTPLQYAFLRHTRRQRKERKFEAERAAMILLERKAMTGKWQGARATAAGLLKFVSDAVHGHVAKTGTGGKGRGNGKGKRRRGRGRGRRRGGGARNNSNNSSRSSMVDETTATSDNTDSGRDGGGDGDGGGGTDDDERQFEVNQALVNGSSSSAAHVAVMFGHEFRTDGLGLGGDDELAFLRDTGVGGDGLLGESITGNEQVAGEEVEAEDPMIKLLSAHANRYRLSLAQSRHLLGSKAGQAAGGRKSPPIFSQTRADSYRKRFPKTRQASLRNLELAGGVDNSPHALPRRGAQKSAEHIEHVRRREADLAAKTAASARLGTALTAATATWQRQQGRGGGGGGRGELAVAARAAAASAAAEAFARRTAADSDVGRRAGSHDAVGLAPPHVSSRLEFKTVMTHKKMLLHRVRTLRHHAKLRLAKKHAKQRSASISPFASTGERDAAVRRVKVVCEPEDIESKRRGLSSLEGVIKALLRNKRKKVLNGDVKALQHRDCQNVVAFTKAAQCDWLRKNRRRLREVVSHPNLTHKDAKSLFRDSRTQLAVQTAWKSTVRRGRLCHLCFYLIFVVLYTFVAVAMQGRDNFAQYSAEQAVGTIFNLDDFESIATTADWLAWADGVLPGATSLDRLAAASDADASAMSPRYAPFAWKPYRYRGDAWRGVAAASRARGDFDHAHGHGHGGKRRRLEEGDADASHASKKEERNDVATQAKHGAGDIVPGGSELDGSEVVPRGAVATPTCLLSGARFIGRPRLRLIMGASTPCVETPGFARDRFQFFKNYNSTVDDGEGCFGLTAPSRKGEPGTEPFVCTVPRNSHNLSAADIAMGGGGGPDAALHSKDFRGGHAVAPSDLRHAWVQGLWNDGTTVVGGMYGSTLRTSMPSMQGKMQAYPGSGYTFTIPADEGEWAAMYHVLRAGEHRMWRDDGRGDGTPVRAYPGCLVQRRSRAILLELAVFDAAQDLQVVAQFLAELTPTGAVYGSATIETTDLVPYSSRPSAVLIMAQVLLVIFVLKYTVEECISAREQWPAHIVKAKLAPVWYCPRLRCVGEAERRERESAKKTQGMSTSERRKRVTDWDDDDGDFKKMLMKGVSARTLAKVSSASRQKKKKKGGKDGTNVAPHDVEAGRLPSALRRAGQKQRRKSKDKDGYAYAHLRAAFKLDESKQRNDDDDDDVEMMLAGRYANSSGRRSNSSSRRGAASPVGDLACRCSCCGIKVSLIQPTWWLFLRRCCGCGDRNSHSGGYGRLAERAASPVVAASTAQGGVQTRSAFGIVGGKATASTTARADAASLRGKGNGARASAVKKQGSQSSMSRLMNYDPAHPDADVEVDADAATGHVHAVGFSSSSSEDDDLAALERLTKSVEDAQSVQRRHQDRAAGLRGFHDASTQQPQPQAQAQAQQQQDPDSMMMLGRGLGGRRRNKPHVLCVAPWLGLEFGFYATSATIPPYLFDPFNYIDVTNYSAFFVFFGLQIWHIWYAADRVAWGNTERFMPELFALAAFCEIKQTLQALNLLLSWLKLLDAVKVNNTFALLTIIIIDMLSRVLPLLFTFCIFLVAFGAQDYLAYSLVKANPVTLLQEFLIQLTNAMGSFSFSAISAHSSLIDHLPTLGVATMILFIFTVWLMMMNLIIAVMLDAYEDVSRTSKSQWTYMQYCDLMPLSEEELEKAIIHSGSNSAAAAAAAGLGGGDPGEDGDGKRRKKGRKGHHHRKKKARKKSTRTLIVTDHGMAVTANRANAEDDLETHRRMNRRNNGHGRRKKSAAQRKYEARRTRDMGSEARDRLKLKNFQDKIEAENADTLGLGLGATELHRDHLADTSDSSDTSSSSERTDSSMTDTDGSSTSAGTQSSSHNLADSEALSDASSVRSGWSTSTTSSRRLRRGRGRGRRRGKSSSGADDERLSIELPTRKSPQSKNRTKRKTTNQMFAPLASPPPPRAHAAGGGSSSGRGAAKAKTVDHNAPPPVIKEEVVIRRRRGKKGVARGGGKGRSSSRRRRRSVVQRRDDS